VRNYGEVAGLPAAKRLFAEILRCRPEQVFVGGNASLQLMYDTISKAYTHGLANSERPWCKEPALKWLCPVPGYDRHFKITESFGFEKEVDWLEFELRFPEKRNEMLKRVAERTLEINKLHKASTDMSKKEYINRYKDSFFECLDECYSKLYGTVPISENMRKELVDQFMLILNKKYLYFIVDESDRVCAFGLCFPGIGDSLKKSGGRLTPSALIKLLKAVRKPTTIDLGLVAVRPEYQNTGINAVIIDGLLDMLSDGDTLKAETNLNLETNTAVTAQWKYFDQRQHKRRRCSVKTI
jgi:hypothetical protein